MRGRATNTAFNKSYGTAVQMCKPGDSEKLLQRKGRESVEWSPILCAGGQKHQ